MKVQITILAVIFLFFLGPLLKPGFYESHDGEAHVARFASYYKAYSDGQFPARWAADLNYGYGSPVFIFYYPLPGAIGSISHLLGIGFEDSYKLLMGLAFIGCSLSFFLWIQNKVGVEVALAGALLYGLAPYHFLNTYVRGDVAEMLALALAPLALLFIDKTLIQPTTGRVLLGILFYSLLILSHNAISLMFSAVFLVYIICKVNMRQREQTLISLLILILGLGTSVFFWLPALYEARFTNVSLFIGDMYKSHFPTLASLVYSPWGFGPNVNDPGGLSAQIGSIHIAIVFLGAILLLLKRAFKRESVFWLFVFIGAVFMTTSESTFLWEKLPLVKLLQFPWRFTALSSFAAAAFSVFVLKEFFNRKGLALLVILLFVSSLPFLKVKTSIAKSDEYYALYKGTTDYHGQASSIWTAGDPGKQAQEPIEVITGEVAVANISRKSNRHIFEVNAKTEGRILDNTIYFPGWQAWVDGEKVPIEFQDINYRGLITFKVPQGLHRVEIKFMESPVRLFSDIVSIITLIAVLTLFSSKTPFLKAEMKRILREKKILRLLSRRRSIPNKK